MASFELTEEYQDLSDSVREFADEVVAPVSTKHDEEHSFPYEVVKQMGEMGLFGLPFPEEFGGMGGDYFALALALEQLGRVDQSVAITLEAGVSLGAMPVYRFGTQAQKEHWLPQLTSAEALAGFGLTEPEAGSDAGGTKTNARLEDVGDAKNWVINGNKEFITNSGTDITRLVTVTAVTGQHERHDGSIKKEISTILVPTDTPGFTAEKAYNKVGWNASDTHPLTLKNVRVPEENLLGVRGRGYANFLSILDEGRIAIAALATGAAQGCVDLSVKYAKERMAFGQNIGKYQAIQFKIARMQARAHTARLAYYDAAARMLAGKPFKTEAAIAKMVAGEAAMDNARDATQVFGGYGFINEFTVARHYRDSKILEVGEGTTEVQLMLIARELGL
ncbi:acyl-CoA dehydrogenase family protein [Arthrobacter bambusae]|uniref:acyl-CoA dehydrogenase family protein n=1 Tax=Arthrobacter bambusae TaxID=1338426 RepID=UPI002785C93C|nr:acyl-CoA dehydrogenase family protein [Arthrobacter bambusae]MDQ0029011.1 alkylation response protein AidB-like acyl-CoA dehydrogenase [Arthrobacter bambusae]MDQ0098587.1 alkylation response protein AidB-like acyl-CoA dehydrogenase [Arthrobacter bambusae]